MIVNIVNDGPVTLLLDSKKTILEEGSFNERKSSYSFCI